MFVGPSRQDLEGDAAIDSVLHMKVFFRTGASRLLFLDRPGAVRAEERDLRRAIGTTALFELGLERLGGTLVSFRSLRAAWLLFFLFVSSIFPLKIPVFKRR